MKKRLLIFYPFIASYRIGLFNRFAKDFEVKALLNDKQSNLDTLLGFDLQVVNKYATFDYEYRSTGLYIGRHLVSTIYFKIIRTFKPDVVWTHEFGIATVVAVILKIVFHYKLFITCDDSIDLAKLRSRPSIRRKLRDFVINRLDGLLAVSPESKIFFDNLYPNMNCKFIYYPIIQDDDVLTQNIAASHNNLSEHLIEQYNLNEKKVILFVARFDPVKNLPLLINAYHDIAKNDNVLVLVGDGEMRPTVNSLISELKLNEKVIMTGALQGQPLYAWYSIANVFVLPSYQECFGAVVNEALVAGCKCIVSDKAGASCLIDNSNGYIFESDNCLDLKKKLSKLLDNISLPKHNKNLMPLTFENHYKKLYAELFSE